MSQCDNSSDKTANEPLVAACIEQIVTAGNIFKLVEEQKKEKEDALSKISELEKRMKAAEMEVAMHKCAVRGLKRVNDEDNSTQGNTEELKENLQKQMEKIEDLEVLNQQLIVKERRGNDELTEARKELIAVLRANTFEDDGGIVIKSMGEVDRAPFENACKRKYPRTVASIKACQICSRWQVNVQNPRWHPFKITSFKGEICEEIIDDDDKTLQELKSEWGDEAYEAVITALEEMNNYNPSGRTVTYELWNLREERRATLKEVICFIMRNVVTKPRRKRRGDPLATRFTMISFNEKLLLYCIKLKFH